VRVPVTSISLVISGAIMAAMRGVKMRRCESQSRNYSEADFHERVFRTSWTSYFWAPPVVGYGVYFLVSTRSHPNWFSFALGMTCILGGLAMVPIFMSTYVSIKNGEVTLIDCGRVRGKVNLEDILSVKVDGTSLIVRAKWDKRLPLPMGTQNDALLLAMLLRYRVKQTQTA
jgi:hypothetical protein